MSEFDWIARYFAPLADREGAAGLSDDVAHLASANRVITTDAIVEHVHFLPDDPVDTIARKLVRINVSDILAKGAQPAEALLTLGWPEDRAEDELKRFADALGADLADWGAYLVGGDTVSSPAGLFASLTLLGVLPENTEPVRRSGAQVGDTIWVSGTVGAGWIGLQHAQKGRSSPARDHYRVPKLPPKEISDLILSYAHASMDVSDGLIADLQKLAAASELGAHLRLDAVPLYEPANGLLDHVLGQCTGGDDYQCLFTASPDAAEALAQSGLTLAPIGVIKTGAGLRLTWGDAPVDLPGKTGFEHN